MTQYARMNESLAVLPGHSPCYGQLYFFDPSLEGQYGTMLNARVSASDGELNRNILATLQRVLPTHNPIAAMFKHAYERMFVRDDLRLSIRLRAPQVWINAVTTKPAADEVGGMFVYDADYRRRRAYM
uniref:Uncharacterized protein n=1 Tax=Anopheles epiroticus TaxID=199890 RepID=A0A182PBL3_9DIPT